MHNMVIQCPTMSLTWVTCLSWLTGGGTEAGKPMLSAKGVAE